MEKQNLLSWAYKTTSQIETIKMPRVIGNNQHKRNFIVALDGGYSSVKGISENMLFCFPSYAKCIKDIDIVGRMKETDMILTDHRTGKTWLVGAFAENTMDIKDIQSTTDESLYTRYRYKSEIYTAIMTAGLGIALFHTEVDENLNICLQTGLPTSYISDASMLKAVLAGDYDFSLRIGKVTKQFRFSIPLNNIGVMEQPRGTLANILYDSEGHVLKEMRGILDSDTLILDIGFGTEDLFSIRSGSNIKDNKTKTYSDTAMRAVFEAVCSEINDKENTSFKIFELQKYLTDGELPILDFTQEIVSTKLVPFGELLQKYNQALNTKSIKRLLEEYNNLLDYQNLIVTGGTGESRYAWIRDMLKGLPHLRVIPGNASDPNISSIYSNVRGYYMSMLLKLQKEKLAAKAS